MSKKASVVITTKNRRDELSDAVRSAFNQTVPVEVLVLDDGSDDGTTAMLKAEFPLAEVHRFEESKGYIVRRNQGAELASGEIIFSIDDDAEFSSPCIIEQTLAEFEDSRIGAVAIPYIEPKRGNRLLQRAPNEDGLWATNQFVGTAHALRRDIFLTLGGYRDHLVHQGEEGDYCIRMLAAGFYVRAGRSDAIIHHESPKRDYRRMDFYARRNDILFLWQNCPFPDLLWRLPATMIGGLIYAARSGRWLYMLKGMLAGWGEIVKGMPRKPVPSKVSRRFKRMKRFRHEKPPELQRAINER